MIAGLALSLAVRLLHYNQSLWCDEMGLAVQGSHLPWHDIVAAGADEYTPNNHVLHTLLVRTILSAGPNADSDTIAKFIRLPSLCAGCLIPLAMVMLVSNAGCSSVSCRVLTLAALNPWLVSFSDEARGYAMMTLLGVIATYLLPDGTRRWPIGYAIAVALMLYTVPVGGMLVVAHGISLLLLRRGGFAAWLKGAIAGGVLAIVLFLPMAKGIWFYIQHPQPAPDSDIAFINQLPRFAIAGEDVGVTNDPLNHANGSVSEILCWIVPVVVLVAGTIVSSRHHALRLPLTVMASGTLLFVLTALAVPGAGQVRFVPWCALWMILSIAALAAEFQRRWNPGGMLFIALVAGGWFLYCDATLLPSQPIREGITLADSLVPSNADISVGFLAADDSVALYGRSAPRHRVVATPGPLAFMRQENRGRSPAGRTPWLVISYESMVRDTAPKFWEYIQANYILKQRLPGRITPVGIYAPRGE